MATSDIITRAKIESEQWTRGMRGMQSDLDKFRSKSKGMSSDGLSMSKMLGTLTSGLGKVAGAFGVGLTAVEAFNRTIGASEQLTDAMGATMEQVNSVVDSFFIAIADADFSNFINGLDDITRRARDAYNAVDDLGTLKMFQSPQAARINADIAEQRAVLRNPDATLAQKEAAKARLEKLTGEMYDLSAELQRYAIDAFKASIRNSIGKNAAGVTDADIDRFVRTNLSSMQAFNNMKRRLAFYEEQIRKNQVEGSRSFTTSGGGSLSFTEYVDTDESKRWKNLLDYRLAKSAATMSETEIEKAFQYLTEAENARGSAANTAASAYRLMNTKTGPTVRTPKTKPEPEAAVPGYVGLPDYDAIRARLKAETAKAFKDGMEESSRNIPAMQIWQPEQFQVSDDVLERMRQKQELYASTTAKVQQLQQALQYASEAERPLIEQNINVLRNMAEYADPAAASIERFTEQAESLNAVASAISSVGDAFGSMGNKTMAAVGRISGSIASLIGTYLSLKAAALKAGVANAAALPPPYNIVMIASVVAAVASAMSTISSFAQGGIVGGADFRDGISARVSSGEMIINEADQRRLFDTIHSGGGGGGGGNSYISGEQIVTVVNAYGRRTGRGELIK